ncbi:zinc finger Y-chromosomal protein 1-like isoform X2 [Coccinella septempunctata]|uniref:zinc finger Y-chromosomal protein 1-like isoform X1 n=1 Tax=Coccinella septempunctata TaxID=41139 RepID=UPI001D08FAC6|nr:zinc finger Y-chromosomal protein 1-like isoform X1 [Coccinella septempunctata]XP_044744170.1 zinc finger Y-chromosomal protein 1-like isoform X2 [Coccinella septempunctata]
MGEHCIVIEDADIDEVKLEDKPGIIDICEHFIDEEGVYDREEFIIKNEGSCTNSSDVEVDANQSTAFFNKKISQVFDPTTIKSEPVHLDQCEFPKCHLIGAREEKYLDEPIQYEHTDHTYCSKDDKNPVKLEVVDIFEQFIDNEGVYDREEYIIENEKINPNTLLIEDNSNQFPACLNEKMPPVLDPTGIKSDTFNLGVVDTCEQFIDDEGVHNKEEFIIKNEGSYINSSDIEVDANQSTAFFNKKIPQVFDPTTIKSEPVHLDQCEFPKCHLVDTGKEKYLDKSTQYDHNDHTYCCKYDEKSHVKSEILEFVEQFIDNEGVHDREEYIIENEIMNSNSLLIEDNSNQSPASFNEEMPLVLATGIKSDMFNLGVVDTCEQFIDEEGVHDREEYIIENEKINPNSLIREGDANQSPAFFTKETPQIFDLENDEALPVTINNQEVHMCDFETNDEKDLALHIKSVHSNIKCHLCEYVTSKKGDFLMHVERVHLDRKKQECYISGYAAHLKTKEHKCHLCKYASSEKNVLEKHIKSVHLKIKEHKCNLCEYAASKKQTLRRHFDTVHLKIKTHRCHLCEYAGSVKEALERHIKSVHLNIKKHKCHLCEFATSKKQTLDSHVKSVHLKIKEHRCYLCEYASSEKNAVEKHIKSVHLKIKEHKCHLCEFATSKKQTLDNHVKSVHLKTKEYKCHLCEFATSKKQYLPRHFDTVHLKIKTHRCHLCEYASSEKKYLEMHVKSVHLNIKEHKCNLCEYAASKKDTLRRHFNSVHLKTKEYKCHLCEYASSEKNVLEKHIKSVHLKIKEHKCNLCEYAASVKNRLDYHVNYVHLKIKD